MVPRRGLEPLTYRLGGNRSIRLSYRGKWVAIRRIAHDNAVVIFCLEFLDN